MSDISALELCAGGGGQALGFEAAGWQHAALIDNDPHACATLRWNRPRWRVVEADLAAVDGREFRGVDLVAGGVPCPPFSVAGAQMGEADQRDLFPEALRIVAEAHPKAVMFENVRGFATAKFAAYRHSLIDALMALGYESRWCLLNAAKFGVPQSRTRFVLVALRPEQMRDFAWVPSSGTRCTVGGTIKGLMAAQGWAGAQRWAEQANTVAPTIVGGSKMHGGPDLGPRRARAAWKRLGVEGRSLADAPPSIDTDPDDVPRLTLDMVALLQGFPDDWRFIGGKTPKYQQIGNAFPPAAARAVGIAIKDALTGFSHEGKQVTQERLVQTELVFG